jgi:hypothetical protein
MGKREKLNILKVKWFCILMASFLCNKNLSAQTTIFGQIKDDNSQPLSSINITVKIAQSQTIIAYAYTDKEGHYLIKLNKPGNYEIDFSAISYKKSINLLEVEANHMYELNGVLTALNFQLKEVIVQTKKPITVKGDTIIYDAAFFAKGNENVVEDLLKKIPGLSVAKDGTIRIGNQEVEKIMVEGDDFFGKGYRILTKNMKANIIESVEVYKKYSNNKLLKGLETSDNVAINLKLKDSLKRQLFGDLNLGYGVIKAYDNHLNLMSLGKKAKFYWLGNFDNVGNDVTGDLNYLIYSPASSAIGDVSTDMSTKNFFSFPTTIYGLKPELVDLKATTLTSINFIYNLNKNLKLKLLNLVNWEGNKFISFGYDAFKIATSEFTNTVNNKISKAQFTSFNKLELTLDISKTQIIDFSSKYKFGHENLINDLNFNGADQNNRLRNGGILFDQTVNYTNRYSDSSVFAITVRFIKENSPQDYQSNHFLFANLFNISNITFSEQHIKNEMQCFGVGFNLLKHKGFELKSGIQFRRDLLKSNLIFSAIDQVKYTPADYQNYLEYNVGDIYLGLKYNYKIKDAVFFCELETHQLSNSKKTNGKNDQQYPIYLNPKIGFNWRINERNIITSYYSYNKVNSNIDDIYENYLLSDYNSFSKGVSSFNQLGNSTILTNYIIGDYSSLIFANVNLLYLKYYDFFASNFIINQNYAQIDRIKIKNKGLLNFNSDVSIALKKIQNNLKFDFGFSTSNYKNQYNSGPLVNVNTNSYNFSLELHSVFNGFFNYEIGSSWTSSKIQSSNTKSTTDNLTFLNLSVNINKKINATVQSEQYRFNDFENKKARYNFIDVNLNYVVKENKLKISLTGKNLTNTKNYISQNITDVTFYRREYQLRPRIILLKTEFRF